MGMRYFAASALLAVWTWAQQVSDDAPLFARSQQAVHRVLSKRAGVQPVHPHSLRHGYKSHHEAKGTPREVLQALMGHGPRNVTECYGDVSSERLLAAIAG